MSGMEILKRANIFCNQACIINSFRFYVGGEGGNFHNIQRRYNVAEGAKRESQEKPFRLENIFYFFTPFVKEMWVFSTAGALVVVTV